MTNSRDRVVGAGRCTWERWVPTWVPRTGESKTTTVQGDDSSPGLEGKHGHVAGLVGGGLSHSGSQLLEMQLCPLVVLLVSEATALAQGHAIPLGLLQQCFTCLCPDSGLCGDLATVSFREMFFCFPLCLDLTICEMESVIVLTSVTTQATRLTTVAQ